MGIIGASLCENDDVPIIDVEFVCNIDTGFYDQITTTTIGTDVTQATEASTIACVAQPEPQVTVDIEYVCDEALDTWQAITTTFVDAVEDSSSTVDTGIACADAPADIVEVDTELVCNADTGFWEYHQITTTNGVPAAAVVTPTTIACQDDPPLDIEQVRQCSDVTNTVHIITTAFDADGNVVAEIADVDTREDCPPAQVECVESQEWTYGIDNTGTYFSYADATYEIVLSDGSTLQWSQTAQASWTPQLQEWSANIQAAADAAGLAWFVEPRAVNNPNPTDISGAYGANPTGLPGAPSIPVAQALIAGGMVARYVNIQICPGQPVPVSAAVVTVADQGAAPTVAADGRPLVTAGAVLGPLQKFFVCRTCGNEPVWYLEDGTTEAEAGQIPNCYEPCGTLTLADSPPDRECEFFFDLACDNNGQNDPANFTNQITRRATVCAGEQIALEYFTEDPADPSALIDYTLVGDFVDCNTGEPVEAPTPPCSDFELATLYRLNGVDGQLRNREWHATEPAASPFPTDSVAGQGFRERHDFTLTPDTDTLVTSLELNDTDNTASELDVQVLDGYVTLDAPMLLRYAGVSEGYWAVEVGECCGPLVVQAESGGFTPDREMLFEWPAGVHRVRIWNIDAGGSNSSATFGYSTDGGVTYVNDNTPPGVTMSTIKPIEQCLTVKVCKDSGALIDLLAGDTLDDATLTTCPQACTPDSAIETNALLGQLIDCICCPDGVELDRLCRSYSHPLTSGYANWSDGGDLDDLASEFGITPTAPEMWVRITEYDCGGTAQSQVGQIFGPYTPSTAGADGFITDLGAAIAGTCISVSPTATGSGPNGIGSTIDYSYDSTQDATLVFQEGVTVGAGVDWFTSAQGIVVRSGQVGDFISSSGNAATTAYTGDALADLDQYVEAEECGDL